MASSGDQYAYNIKINVENQEQAAALIAQLKALGIEADQVRVKGAQTGDGAKKLGQMLGQVGYAFDDAAYGARGLTNNVQQLAVGLMGISPILGGIATAAIPLVMAAFKDQINAGLEWVGILDDSLIPKTKEAEERLGLLAEAAAKLPEGLQAGTIAAIELTKSISDIVEKLQGTTTEDTIFKAILEDTGYASSDLQRITAEIGKARAEINRMRTDPNASLSKIGGGGRKTPLEEAIERENELIEEQNKIIADRTKYAQDQFRLMAAAAGSSDEALLRLHDRIVMIGAQTGRNDLQKLADQIWDMSEAGKQAKKEQEEAAKAAEEAAKKAEEAKRKQEEAARKAAEAEKKATAEAKKSIKDWLQDKVDAVNKAAEIQKEANVEARKEEERHERLLEAGRRAREAEAKAERDRIAAGRSEAAQYAMDALGPEYQAMIEAQLSRYLGATDRAGNRRFSDQQAREQTRADVIRDLVEKGLNPELAVEASNGLFDKAADQIEKLMMAIDLMNGAQAQQLNRLGLNDAYIDRLVQQARLNAIRANAQNPWRNNRSGYP